jgi:hypothetical protein
MNGRKEELNLFFYLHPCDNKTAQRLKKKFIFSLFFLAGKCILLAVGRPVNEQVVSACVCHTFFELLYFLLDKNERIEERKKERKKKNYSRPIVNSLSTAFIERERRI